MTINDEIEWNLILYNKERLDDIYKDTSFQEHCENIYSVNQNISEKELAELIIISINVSDQISEIKEKINNSIGVYFSTNSGLIDINKEIICILFVIRLINIYIQKSYTGPKVDDFDFSTLNRILSKENIDNLNKLAFDDLRINGEDVYSLSPNIFLFWLIGVILNNNHLKRIKSISWWSYRYYWLYQRLFYELNPYLKEEIMKNLKSSKIAISQLDIDKTLKNQLFIALNIEFGMVEEYYFNNKEAKIYFEKAQELSGLKIKLTGAPGRRTKFQTEDQFQLILFASSNIKESTITFSGIPKNHILDDDTYFDQVQYSKSNIQEFIDDKPLNPIDQCILINLIRHIKFTNPQDDIINEQIRPYVDRILKDPVNWQTYTMGLLDRCRIENNKARTVERSLFQLEALVNQIDEDNEPLYSRIKYFFQLIVPAKWELQKELAQSYLSLGMIRSAMELFKKCELFENVIDCLVLLKELDNAVVLVDNLIEKYPNSPKYLSLKGDILEDPQYWNKAWLLSGEKYSRSMRQLGYYYYRKKDYSSSMECFLKSLEINYLFENAWFVCGCAALNLSDCKIASMSFIKVVTINDHNSEAWNNLATIYLKNSDLAGELELVENDCNKKDYKKQAYISLKHAHKLSPENWKISSNLLLVCMSIKKYQEAIPLFRTVITRNSKNNNETPIDLEILNHLILVSTQNDDENIQASRLILLMDLLIEEVILPIINNRSKDIWLSLSTYYKNLYHFNRAIETMLNAYRSLSTDPLLSFDQTKFTEAVSISYKLIDLYKEAIQFGQSDNTDNIYKDWSTKTKMLLRNLENKSRDAYEDTDEFKKLHNLIESI